MGMILKEGWQEFCVYRIWRNLIIVFISIFMGVNKTNAVSYCDIITIKEDCCWLFFFKTKYSV